MTNIDRQPKTRLHYLKDGALYMLWKYLNGRRLVRKNELGFDDITPIDMSIGTGAMLFLQTLHNLGLELETPIFNNGVYEFFATKLAEEEIRNLKSGSKAEMALTKILNNKFTFQDLLEVSILFNRINITEFFSFSNVLSKTTLSTLGSFVDLYLNEFIENNLEVENQNYLRFNKQKEEFITLLKIRERSYGNQFIIKEPDIVYFTTNEHLFVHTLISLEKLGYFTVQNIWVLNLELPPEEQTDDYKVKLVLSDQFYRETKPQSIPLTLVFDTKTSQLVFQNKHIGISKTKDSDAHYLLQTLFKDPKKIWNNDEILSDWHIYEETKAAKKKAYFAGRKVNDIVAAETTIRDFLQVTTKIIKINEKYLQKGL